MKKIVVASNNRHKISEIEAMLAKIYGGEIKALSLSDIGFTKEIEENGKTFEENAEIKARAAAALGYTAIADDSGLGVDALDGKPGIYSARFAGEPCSDAENNKKLLALMADVPDEKRGAKFVCVLCCITSDGRELFARGECPGTILHRAKGEGGFGYDPLFLYENGKSFAELSPEEKNKVSHRARAMARFAELAKETKILD